MTPAQTAMIATAVADILKAYGEKHVEPLAAENAVLRGRMEALEAHVKALPAPRDGVDGKDGAPGRDGIDGAPGAKGDPGDRGEPGIAGKDGAPGLKGDAGEAGRPGVDGKSVEPAEVRAWVMDEVAKAIKAYPAPRDGRDGKEGQPGRDALELIPEFGMNEAASYQRGTWVIHRGGLFVAFRTTDPVQKGDFAAAGWHAAVNGFADMRVELAADQRTLMLSLDGSDGRTVTKQIKTPMQIHRGVWREGITYERGDNVSSGGSTWHANETTTDKPGEGSKAWTLTTKRGRDGKDAGEKTT